MMVQLAKIADSGGAGWKANVMGLKLTSLRTMLVKMLKVTAHRHVWLLQIFWLVRGRSFKEELVVSIVFPY